MFQFTQPGIRVRGPVRHLMSPYRPPGVPFPFGPNYPRRRRMGRRWRGGGCCLPGCIIPMVGVMLLVLMALLLLL